MATLIEHLIKLTDHRDRDHARQAAPKSDRHRLLGAFLGPVGARHQQLVLGADVPLHGGRVEGELGAQLLHHLVGVRACDRGGPRVLGL